MYSINQDYLRLSEFLGNGKKEEVIYPGLKPFNPRLFSCDGKDCVLQKKSEVMTIVHYIPVFPVEEKCTIATFPDKDSGEKEFGKKRAPGPVFARNMKPPGCGFCRRNGERESFCQAHTLKDENGNVSCPILRNYTCPKCNASGDKAHTVAYCPEGRDVAPITSIRSLRKSCGCKWTDQHCHHCT